MDIEREKEIEEETENVKRRYCTERNRECRNRERYKEIEREIETESDIKR